MDKENEQNERDTYYIVGQHKVGHVFDIYVRRVDYICQLFSIDDLLVDIHVHLGLNQGRVGHIVAHVASDGGGQIARPDNANVNAFHAGKVIKLVLGNSKLLFETRNCELRVVSNANAEREMNKMRTTHLYNI